MAILVFGISTSGVLQAAAQAPPESHFRFTAFGWQQTPNTNEVTIVGQHSWRICFGSAPAVGEIRQCGDLTFGDGSPSIPYYVKVTLVNNVGAGFIVGEITCRSFCNITVRS